MFKAFNCLSPINDHPNNFFAGKWKTFRRTNCGRNGVDKRIVVLAELIKISRTIYDLIDFEQAKAPPYSYAKDPLNMTVFTAENILLQWLNVIY